jgi:probable rRNA maturation factor
MTAPALRIEVTGEAADQVDPSDHEAVVAAACFAAAQLGLHPESELSVAFVSDDEMARLHEEWMDLPGPTDVLSFPMDELRPVQPGAMAEPGVLGDLVLAPAFIARQAAAHDATLRQELELLTVHGMLHLVGYDHADAQEEHEMFGLQSRILDGLRAEVDA